MEFNENHSLTPSFETFAEELTDLLRTFSHCLPVDLSVLVIAEIWGHERRYSSGTLSIHRIEDARVEDIPDSMHCRIVDDVTTTCNRGYANDTPIALSSIVVTVRPLIHLTLFRIIKFNAIYFNSKYECSWFTVWTLIWMLTICINLVCYRYVSIRVFLDTMTNHNLHLHITSIRLDPEETSHW
jgi:hypothetical protein